MSLREVGVDRKSSLPANESKLIVFKELSVVRLQFNQLFDFIQDKDQQLHTMLCSSSSKILQT